LARKQTFVQETILADRGLIIFPGALGDLMCLLPSLRARAARFPEVALELMARAELARFAVGRMGIRQGHSIDRPEVARLFAQNGTSEARPFFSQFSHIDCFFAAGDEQFRRSLKLAAGVEVDISFYRFRPPTEGHVSAAYLRMIGEPVIEPLRSAIELMPEDLSLAGQRLQALGLEPGRFVLLLPGSGSIKKNWPAENFAALAKRIRSEAEVLVVLGPTEVALGPVFLREGLTVLKDLELGELAGIARCSQGFVGNDSGVSHLAAAAGARGLVLFGPTQPQRWRPLGKVKVIRRVPLECLSAGEVYCVLAELLDLDPPKV
jgi:heptosyltransferase III